MALLGIVVLRGVRDPSFPALRAFQLKFKFEPGAIRHWTEYGPLGPTSKTRQAPAVRALKSPGMVLCQGRGHERDELAV